MRRSTRRRSEPALEARFRSAMNLTSVALGRALARSAMNLTSVALGRALAPQLPPRARRRRAWPSLRAETSATRAPAADARRSRATRREEGRAAPSPAAAKPRLRGARVRTRADRRSFARPLRREGGPRARQAPLDGPRRDAQPAADLAYVVAVQVVEH